MKTVFFCSGSVRGNCGHNHQTPDATEQCRVKDMRACKAQGGYSDRSVRYANIVEGEVVETGLMIQDGAEWYFDTEWYENV